MSKNSTTNKTKKTTTEIPDEVEELLKAAQDDMLLKLSINSHMAHSSSQNTTIDPDLDSRFQALKSKKSKSKLPKASVVPDAEKNNRTKDVNEADDILARFTVLKKSIPSYSESARAGSGVLNNQKQDYLPDDDNGDEEDEVEKVIKWARDAARLDPSPPSDIEDNDNDVDDDGDTEEDSDEEVFASKTSKRR